MSLESVLRFFHHLPLSFFVFLHVLSQDEITSVIFAATMRIPFFVSDGDNWVQIVLLSHDDVSLPAGCQHSVANLKSYSSFFSFIGVILRLRLEYFCQNADSSASGHDAVIYVLSQSFSREQWTYSYILYNLASCCLWKTDVRPVVQTSQWTFS